MRDAHKIKEKIDLSLDHRQLVSLFIGGLVVLGAVFVLGVVVGKKLAIDEGNAATPDLLTTLDAKAEEMARAQGEPTLTFHDELTRKADPPAPKPAEPPQPNDAKPKEPPAEPTEASPLPAGTGEGAAEGEPEETAVAERPAGPEIRLPSLEETIPVRTAKDGGQKDALAKAKRPQEAVAGGAFTLQLSASQDKAEADRFAAKLRERGLAPFVVEAQVPGRGTWYRVRMGSFPSREAADSYLRDFRRETQLEAFVAASN